MITWNVNGLRSSLVGGALESIRKLEPNVLCLQEVKMELPVSGVQIQLLPQASQGSWADLPPYQYAGPSRRAGYAGVGTFSDQPALRTRVGMGIDEFDREGRVLTTWYEDFAVVNGYFPHSHRTLSRLNYKLLFLKSITGELEKLLFETNGKVIVCGDLNIAHTARDLTNAKENEGNAGFHEQERVWLDNCINSGLFVDAFRLFCGDAGHYTWWSRTHNCRQRNIGWRLDYFLVSSALRGRIKSCVHLSHVTGSDHCPVMLEIA
ncbi:MAG: exodeoxyribonuclease III [Deltaproteobacteria bacterium]|nr:exodeoxyribonuclease III [Deltaproteobacteria bacterium]